MQLRDDSRTALFKQLGVLGGLTLLVLGFALAFACRIARSVKGNSDAAGGVRSGDYATAPVLRTGDELEALASALQREHVRTASVFALDTGTASARASMLRVWMTRQPSDDGVTPVLLSLSMVGLGIYMLSDSVSVSYRSTITCGRERGVVSCELRRVYPGSLTTTEQLELRSAYVAARRYTSGRRRHGTYDILVLNSEIELDRAANKGFVAAQLNNLLQGKIPALTAAPLERPQPYVAILFLFLGTVFSLGGILSLRVLWLGRSR